jgi:hypothetical protein
MTFNEIKETAPSWPGSGLGSTSLNVTILSPASDWNWDSCLGIHRMLRNL